MPFLTTFRIALRSLRGNRMRSFLAMLGIIIGIAAVISMLAIGAGAREDIMKRISSMGTNLLSVHPAQMSFRGVGAESTRALTLDDAMAILNIEGVEAVSPVVRSNAQLKWFSSNVNSAVYGTAVTWTYIRNYQVEHGRFFTESEVEDRMRVAVIGAQTASDLGIGAGDIGKFIKIKGIRFKLLGIFKAKGEGGPGWSDNLVVIPYTTAMNVVFGMEYLNEINIKVAEGSDVNKVEREVETLLRTRHHIRENEENDFRVFNQAEILETASSASRTFSVLLGAIASISLIVGGIGIMNIMLVTVTERTREIGIRKAIGAKKKDILMQFLLEAVIMCVVSGMIGVALGILASKIIGGLSEFRTSVQLSGILLALIFSVSVGIFFGYYPARQAAQLDPVVALSYE